MNKNNYNTLYQYIYDNSFKEYRKETINGLFRAILEPVIENQKFEACILFRLNDLTDKETIIKRLSFSGASLYSYCSSLEKYGYCNIEKNNIWKNTEFVIVLGSRYSAAMLWDYSQAQTPETTPLCILYNSRTIQDIIKKIIDNSLIDKRDEYLKYMPDRRENTLLNKSIKSIVNILDLKNEEIIFSEIEKKQILKSDDTVETARIVAEKAKFIAHEIKNNLSIINLYSKISQKKTDNLTAIIEEEKKSIKESLNNINTASENISSLINDLRCLSTPYITEINIKSFIYSTVIQCDEKAKKAGVNISIDDFNDIIVRTDKTKLSCALINIIFNAIEACKAGDSVIISLLEEKNEVSIYIKNTGAKIPEEIQNKVFDIDFTTKEKGNGLGLAICRKQLELVNGNIKFIHSNEKETLFEIVLPLK